MLQTENPNGNPNNARNKTPLEREFEQSQTYKVIHEVGDKVAQGLNQAGITSETVSRGINEAAKEINRAVDSLNRSLGGRSAQIGRYRSPQQNPAQNGGPYQYPYTNRTAKTRRRRRAATRTRRRRTARSTARTARRARCRRPCGPA